MVNTERVPYLVNAVLPCVTGSDLAVEFSLSHLVVSHNDKMCLGAFRNEDEAEGFAAALQSGEIECPDWSPEEGNELVVMWSEPSANTVDVSAPEGFEVPEVTAAKDAAMQVITDGLGVLGIDLDDDDFEYPTQDADPISMADSIIEGLIAAGWRPTVKTV
jgi:hypothetical protein